MHALFAFFNVPSVFTAIYGSCYIVGVVSAVENLAP